ncbi:aldehyde dehydrogenase (plasmid) [Paracoccus versutus]|uniref:Betaine-aldehyde dehydrogenase n=1 Tax=Paracoccus versutus TaxID=34007 RepID=A0AAQ0KJU2_PARVE|nr:aldehyde dehydrogenase [Paracoccus versutus]KGJ03073.1 aldehyde dehydrogenase [Paracoccus versutus]REG27663.1 betaine-aldehyde dehydrogenase [Paracoccus versutus]WEJ82285.1 aldehyde dehydrogenase [Paracoccus versutus]
MTARRIELKHPGRFYIGGEWVEPAGTGTFDVLDCATEEVAATVARAESADMRRAVQAARAAFDQGPWPRMAPAERAPFLERLAERLEAMNDDFAQIWSIESGVVYKVAQPRIGLFISGAFRQYAAMAATYPFEVEQRSQTGHRGLRVQEPVGVTAVIIPWNGPAGLLAYKVAPALLAGCTVIVKSAPEAPCSAYLFAEICDEIGLPPGVVNILTADRAESEELVRDPGVDKITFTGSTAAGRRIASAAGERIARVTLELGGKSPAVVLDDYDIETAANTLGGFFFGYLTGQVCHSLTRIIVPRAKHDAMVEALSAVAQGIVLGDPFDAATTSGPLALARQRDTVERYVAQGLAEGARLATGGRRPSHLNRGFFFEPTVFGNVSNDMTIAREEIFGPVLGVIAVEDEAEAIRTANDTIFGLNGAVFTNDRDRALRVARQIRSGTVGHNGPRTDFSIGFGGFRQSGIGREGGPEGLAAFLESKTIVLDEPA